MAGTAGKLQYIRQSLVRPISEKLLNTLFYFEKPVPTHSRTSDQDWLCRGPVDKPVYLVVRSMLLEEYKGYYPEMELMYEKSGFAFCRRLPPHPDSDNIKHDKR